MINGEKTLCRIIEFYDLPSFPYIVTVNEIPEARFAVTEDVSMKDFRILGRKCHSIVVDCVRVDGLKTTVTFSDGTTEEVTLQSGDKFNLEMGIAMCC